MGFIHHLQSVNHWAILVAALIQWLLGALWYSPVLFARPWMAMIGVTPNPDKRKSIVWGMLSSLIGDIILSFILWHIIFWSGAVTWKAGAFVGCIVWLGFFAAPNFAQGIYESRPFKLFAINNGYWLVCLFVTGALLAVWR
jgi:hypothetical protein